ncbi:MAG: hypothetical protein JNL01_11215 [Bdellovibrionales bacterium]|nr:hypothetical protein [Bdellovibrionales bacterium]
MRDISSIKKLPPEAASDLRSEPIRVNQAYELTWSAVYVFLKRNQKFVAVKGPKDFFTPEELQKLAPFEVFFTPKRSTEIDYYQEKGRLLRRYLESVWDVEQKLASDPDPKEEPPASFEVSANTMEKICEVWGTKRTLMNWEIVAYIDSVCRGVPGELWLRLREISIQQFDEILYRSSWVLFFALHLGYTDIDFLNRYRTELFKRALGDSAEDLISPELDEVEKLVNTWLGKTPEGLSSSEIMENWDSRVAQKISFRLDQVNKYEEARKHGS